MPEPVIFHWEPVPHAPSSAPAGSMPESFPTFHFATPVVRRSSYASFALRMNPPRQESWARGLLSPILHTVASRMCRPGFSPSIS